MPDPFASSSSIKRSRDYGTPLDARIRRGSKKQKTSLGATPGQPKLKNCVK